MKTRLLMVIGSLVAGSVSVAAADQVVGPSSADITLLAVFVFVALGFSFVCSIAEAVLLSITPSYIEKLRATDNAKADKLKALRQDNVDRSLAAILTVNTIAHTLGAIAAGAKATDVFGSAWIGVFSAVMTLAILFLSEIIPKTIGAVYWRGLVGATMGFIRGSIILLYPLILLSEGLTKLIARGKEVHAFSRDEFVAMANIGERSGHIEEHEGRIIRNLIQFRSLQATDIMTPRTVMTAFQEDASVTDVLVENPDHTFSRMPVYGKDVDDITGFVLRDEILALEAQDKGDAHIGTLKRELARVQDTVSLPRLLEQFLDSRQHIALVVDSFGGTKGLVTLEDVIESLLGMEIMDEMDNVRDMRILARKRWRDRASKLGIEDHLLADKDR